MAGDARPAELLDRRHPPAAAAHGSSTLDATATTASSDTLRDEGGADSTPVPSLPALGPWAPPAERRPSLESSGAARIL